jgi:hypothetical protein
MPRAARVLEQPKAACPVFSSQVADNRSAHLHRRLRATPRAHLGLRRSVPASRWAFICTESSAHLAFDGRGLVVADIRASASELRELFWEGSPRPG